MEKKKKVMVIDDEKDFLRITKLNLEKTNNYEVLTLSKAKEALPYARSFKPDIILLDMLMPKIGGIEVCEALNDDPLGKDIPIIIVSALDKNVDKISAFKNGVVGYLVKPAGLDKIVSEIEKVLGFKQ
ncbi:MAG: response regulator [Candidatus Omnitrophota bacterium]